MKSSIVSNAPGVVWIQSTWSVHSETKWGLLQNTTSHVPRAHDVPSGQSFLLCETEEMGGTPSQVLPDPETLGILADCRPFGEEMWGS